MQKVDIKLFGAPEQATFIKKNKLLRMNVRYIGTDIKFSQYDIYQDNRTGELYATNL